MRVTTAALSLAGLLAAVPAAAVDRLVDDAGIPCLGGALPLHTTVADAVSAAAPGETILVCAGTYFEHVTIDKTDLTLQAQGIVDVSSPGGPGSGFHVTADRVTIQGFDLSGYTGVDECGIRVVAAADADIRDNHVHASIAGVCVVGGTDPHVRRNVTEGNTLDGIRLLSTTGGEVSSNISRDNGAAGILVSVCGDPPLVDHNLVTGNDVAGILVRECGAVVSHNTVRGDAPALDGQVGILVEDTRNRPRVTRNVVQSLDTGVLLRGVAHCELSFNSATLNQVGIDLVLVDECLVKRNNATKNVIDCRWDGIGFNVFVGNSCTLEIPPGAWD